VKSGITRFSNTAVLLPQIFNLRTARRDFRRIVRRTVVDDDDSMRRCVWARTLSIDLDKKHACL
jgi:hypothetical protein